MFWAAIELLNSSGSCLINVDVLKLVPLMASNDCYGDNYDLVQESIEIKEEKFEIVSASSEVSFNWSKWLFIASQKFNSALIDAFSSVVKWNKQIYRL